MTKRLEITVFLDVNTDITKKYPDLCLKCSVGMVAAFSHKGPGFPGWIRPQKAMGFAVSSPAQLSAV